MAEGVDDNVSYPNAAKHLQSLITEIEAQVADALHKKLCDSAAICEASVALHNLSKVEDTEIAHRAVAARDRTFDSVRQHMDALQEKCAQAYTKARRTDDHGRFNKLLEHLIENLFQSMLLLQKLQLKLNLEFLHLNH